MPSSQPSSKEKQELHDLSWKDEAARQISTLRNIIEALPYPFFVIDAEDYSIRLANSSARLIGNIHQKSRCYEASHQRTSPCRGPDHPCPLQEVRRTYRSARAEHLHKDADGRQSYLEVHAFPVFDDRGGLSEIIEYYVDITERKQLELDLQKSEENERLRISRDLHDHIGQMLVYLKLKLERGMMLSSESERDKALEEVLDSLIDTMKELRMVSRRLVAGFVKKQSLREALTDMVTAFERTSIIRVKFSCLDIPDNISPQAQTNIYRIVQEALANVAKHSTAKRVRISLFIRKKRLQLIVRDNGQGPDATHLEDQSAFRTMKYRVQQLGGQIGFIHQEGSHFDVRITFPEKKLFEADGVMPQDNGD
jgi:signal transduction histidine kinase